MTGRFLALAAAFMTLGSNFQAAKTLHVLLDEFSSNEQMLPTVKQLKDLFDTLESKLKCSGFADLLIGWSTLVFSTGSVMESLCLSTTQPHEISSSEEQEARTSSSGDRSDAASTSGEAPRVCCA